MEKKSGLYNKSHKMHHYSSNILNPQDPQADTQNTLKQEITKHTIKISEYSSLYNTNKSTLNP